MPLGQVLPPPQVLTHSLSLAVVQVWPWPGQPPPPPQALMQTSTPLLLHATVPLQLLKQLATHTPLQVTFSPMQPLQLVVQVWVTLQPVGVALQLLKQLETHLLDAAQKN